MYGVRQFKNKITIFYFLEYNLFNQLTQKSLYGDLSITGLVGDSLERQALSSHNRLALRWSRSLT
jgi:hypothetical protein